MKHVFKEKIHEALRSVLPLTLTVLAVNFLLMLSFGEAMPWGMLAQFLIGAAFLLLGLCFLALGEDVAMIPMGDRVGAHLSRTGKYSFLIICSFLIGALITIAEPNLAVFASLLPGIADKTVIFAAAAGVGLFLVFGVLRVIKRFPLSITLTMLFAVLFALAAFAPKSSLAVSFDAGGVATGPITAAFIMSVGIGLASVRGGKGSTDNSFGAVAFCTLGPIAALLFLGLIGKTGNVSAEVGELTSAAGWEIILDFIREIPIFLEEVALALLPIILFFVIFHFVFLRLSARSLVRIGVGVLYAFIGHTLFLTGVCVGFIPAGNYLGKLIASLPYGLSFLLVPAAMMMSGLIVRAEPAVHVLNEQVEDVTVGAVSKRAMMTMLTVGVVIACGLAMLRLLTGVSLWYFLIAGYAISLTLSFIVPKAFTAIAFDTGGAASGAMTIAFLVPFAKGACIALNGSGESVLTDAFGLIALIVMLPIITVQILGLLYKIELNKVNDIKRSGDDTVTIIEFDRQES